MVFDFCQAIVWPIAKNLGAVSDRVGLGLEFGPAFEGSQLLAGCSAVEAKFGLFEKEGKVGFRNAVVSAERALGLVPEVLDSVDGGCGDREHRRLSGRSWGGGTRRRRGRHRRDKSRYRQSNPEQPSAG